MQITIDIDNHKIGESIEFITRFKQDRVNIDS